MRLVSAFSAINLLVSSSGFSIHTPFSSSIRRALITSSHDARRYSLVILQASSSEQQQQELDDSAIQWELFKKHHALGSWKGIWTTVDYMGDVLDETVASVDLVVEATDGQDDDDRTAALSSERIQQTHIIAVGAKRSDCKTCFDSDDLRTIPVATYTPNHLNKLRFAACGMVNGPTLLKTGVMATELVLHHADARVRVVFQHAPVWSKDVEPGQGPPQGLKLFRVLYSREALRAAPPTAETEASELHSTSGSGAHDNDRVTFFRTVPPFDWHKQWAGSSWTWGPQIGNRGWALEELDEGDAWHGSAPVAEWNLRLPGGIFMQCPRVITDLTVGLCRLAWLPNAETLLRLEAGVSALQPMALEDESVIGFEPPTLASLRCDVLQKIGDLEGEPPFRQERNQQAALEDIAAPPASTLANGSQRIQGESPEKNEASGAASSHTQNANFNDPRDALRL